MYKFENIYSKNDIIKIIVNIVWIDGGISIEKIRRMLPFCKNKCFVNAIIILTAPI